MRISDQRDCGSCVWAWPSDFWHGQSGEGAEFSRSRRRLGSKFHLCHAERAHRDFCWLSYRALAATSSDGRSLLSANGQADRCTNRAWSRAVRRGLGTLGILSGAGGYVATIDGVGDAHLRAGNDRWDGLCTPPFATTCCANGHDRPGGLTSSSLPLPKRSIDKTTSRRLSINPIGLVVYLADRRAQTRSFPWKCQSVCPRSSRCSPSRSSRLSSSGSSSLRHARLRSWRVPRRALEKAH